MALCTLAARVVVDLAALVPAQALINRSLGPGPGTSENTTRTAAMAAMAARRWVARMLGGTDPGALWNDADATVGDTRASDWATRYAWHLYRSAFQTVPDPLMAQEGKALSDELEMYAAQAVQEASEAEVVADTDDDGEVDDG